MQKVLFVLTAKNLVVKPIASRDAREFVKKHHYSGKVAANSQLHLGVFWNDKLEGVMQFGPSLDKSRIIPLVEGTGWNDFLELNRMAFSDVLPRNSESRAIAVAMRLIKKHSPNIKWIVSFADGTQCGDGTIYRASGFVLTGVKQNKTIMRMPDGSVVADISLNIAGRRDGKTASWWRKHGAKSLEGFQLRYIYFLDKSFQDRLTVPILPFSEIDRLNARMYKGEKI